MVPSCFEAENVNLFLKEGRIDEVRNNSMSNRKSGYVIVVERIGNRLSKIRLYCLDLKNYLEEFDITESLFDAFLYSCSYQGNSNFSLEIDKLRKFFIKNIGKSCFTKDERLEIKKFMFLTYKQAKEKRLL